MKHIGLFLAVTGLAVASATAVLSPAAPALASASSAICHGTSVVQGVSHHRGVPAPIVVPTVRNGDGQWACNLLPSSQAGLAPVERLQIDLDYCYNAGLAVDGEYGPATTAAVGHVQYIEGVRQDGDYGPKTIRGGFRYRIMDTDACTTIAGA